MLTNSYSQAASPDFQFQQIAYSGIDEIVHLWSKVKSTLPEGREHHLKPLAIDQLKSHFRAGYPVLGIVDTSRQQLAAVLLVTPNLGDFPAYRHQSIIELPPELNESGSGIVQCVAVDPDYQRQGLMKTLLAKTESVLPAIGLSHLFAKVADDNTASRATFAAAGWDTRLASQGSYGACTYDATYWVKEPDHAGAEPIALQDLPVFNGTHVRNEPDNVVPFPTPERR